MRTLVMFSVLTLALFAQGDQSVWIRETTSTAETASVWLWVHQIDQTSQWSFAAYSKATLAILGTGSAPTEQGARDSAADAATLDNPIWTQEIRETGIVGTWQVIATQHPPDTGWHFLMASYRSNLRIEFKGPNMLLGRWQAETYATALAARGIY